MTVLWPLAEPLLVDRAAHRRSEDMSHAHAVVASAGTVWFEDGAVVRVPPAQRPHAELTVYLGLHGEQDLVAVVPADEWTPPTGRMLGLRDLLAATAARGTQGDADRELASTATAITTWHANHPRCAFCGDPTVPTQGGWVRRCERDDRDHYPRTDPAVIVAITDPDDRILLAHASYWSARRFSHLAGYVEPGESLEQAVHREVMEEAGLTVAGLTYAGSQPWPFPASVMVGYRAHVNDPALNLDQTEIDEARWVTRQELAALVVDGHILLAPPGSIARRMLDDWHGDPAELIDAEVG